MKHNVTSSVNWKKENIENSLKKINKLKIENLTFIKDKLNEFFFISEDEKYYDILLGDWLTHHIHFCYAAYINEFNSKIHLENLELKIPYDVLEYDKLRINNNYEITINNIINIIKKNKKINEINLLSNLKNNNRKKDSKLINIIKLIINFILFKKTAPILVIDYSIKSSYLDWIKNLFLLRKFLRLYKLINYSSKNININKDFRIKNFIKYYDNNIDSIIKSLIFLCIPLSLLENYIEISKAILSKNIIRPKYILSSSGLQKNIEFKILFNEWRKNKTKLLYHQHGGNYGLDFFHSLEDYEIQNSDIFYYWGLCGNKKKYLQVPYRKIIKNQKIKNLFVMVDYPKNIHRIHYQPMGTKVQHLFNESKIFINQFTVSNNLFVRPYRKDYGWGFSELSKINNCIIDKEKSSYKSITNSSLIICNYLGTIWLESIYLNIPTICFYDDEVYKFRNESALILNNLHKVGILHKSAISASKKAIEVNHKPNDWWNSKEVSEAIKIFKLNYANLSNNWIKNWKNEFNRILE